MCLIICESVHKETFNCDICGLNFKRYFELKMHEESVAINTDGTEILNEDFETDADFDEEYYDYVL